MPHRKTTERPIKVYIVLSLATGKRPSTVAGMVKRYFGREMTRQAVHAYDPRKKAGRALGSDLATLFHDTQRLFDKKRAQRPLRLELNQQPSPADGTK